MLVSGIQAKNNFAVEKIYSIYALFPRRDLFLAPKNIIFCGSFTNF